MIINGHTSEYRDGREAVAATERAGRRNAGYRAALYRNPS